jgi:PIN like domain
VSSESLVFFTDECLGRRVPQKLQEAGLDVRLYLDRFKPAVPDVEWLPVVSQSGWVVLTKDEMIGRRVAEQAVIAQCHARVFVMASTWINTQVVAEGFIKASKAMVRLAFEREAPFIAKVYKSGEVKLWKDCDRLKALLQQYSDTDNSYE